MFDSNKSNSSCGFGGEVVSYLYGELNSTERKDFEAHLETCVECPEELTAFSTVSGAILDWKSREFDHLKGPEINSQPGYESQAATTVQTRPAVSGLWDSLTSLVNGWQMASVAGALLLTVALLWFFSGTGTPEKQVADSAPEKLSSQPAADKPETATAVSPSDNDVAPATPEIAASPRVESKAVLEKVETAGPLPKNTPKRPAQDVKRRIPVETPKNNPQPKTADIQKVPRLTELAETETTEEEEGLRLSDLFAISESEEE